MYQVWTDGSCLGNPGNGGWAVIDDDDLKLCGNLKNTTNNVMEMTAIIKALEVCLTRGHTNASLYTDSNYVKQGITKWIHNWKRNGWKTSTGDPVKNKELWIQIDTLRGRMEHVKWNWVKAHNGDPKNEEVDRLAYEAAGGGAKKQKFYAVVKGYTPGIYTTWDEAKTQVDGYPGAVFKSFKTRKEAEESLTINLFTNYNG